VLAEHVDEIDVVGHCGAEAGGVCLIPGGFGAGDDVFDGLVVGSVVVAQFGGSNFGRIGIRFGGLRQSWGVFAMRSGLVLAVVIAGFAAGVMPVSAESKAQGCMFNGKELKGKVQIVNSFADFKVQVVTSFPDLKVQKVTSFPDACGKWEFVTSFPDFKIQLVNSFPDFTIQYVDSFPGVP
jgi:hypothetical protein